MARISRGLSRRINVLADKTLLAAYAGQTRNLRPRHLAAAARDARASSAPAPASRERIAWGGLLAGLAAGLGLLAFVAWQAQEAPPPGALSARPSPTPPAASPNTTAPAPAPANTPDMTALASQTGHWLARAAPETFVIQLASAKDAAEAAVLLQEFSALPTPRPLRVLYGLSQGRAAWMILAGEFPGRNEAMAALQGLPEQNSGSRFLRTVGKMRTVVLPSG
jgi:septal ring-binding cell division protein DamX